MRFARSLAQRHGLSFLANLSLQQKSGVGLLFKRPWTLVNSFSFGPCVFVVLRHSDNFCVVFVVGHFHNRPHERRAQWVALRERAALFAGLLVVLLADHNSILSSLESTRANAWSQNELAAMEAERAALGSLGLFDASAPQFPERESPGYTRTVVLPSANGEPAVTVSRRTDHISVTDNLLQYGTSMFMMPVGFSNHSAVVMQFIGMGVDGHRPVPSRAPPVWRRLPRPSRSSVRLPLNTMKTTLLQHPSTCASGPCCLAALGSTCRWQLSMSCASKEFVS